MAHAGSKNRSVIHICRKGPIFPVANKSEEQENIEGRQDGGHGGALWGAVVQDNIRKGFAIKCKGDASVSKKGADPVTECQVEAKKAEDVGKAIDVEVVKETLDVK